MSAIRAVGRGAVQAGVATPKQVLLIMQLSAFLLLVLGLQVSAATYSQTVSFTGKDVPLKTVFASVKKQTGYGVFFENGEAMLQSSAPVTLDLKNVSLEMFLRICLKDQPLEYVLEGKTIFIKKKEVVITVESPSGDSILQIKGRVTNDKGEPLVNANITVKRTGHGTITDANGNFYLRNVNSADVVMVSFIGYKMQNVPLKDRVNLMVVLETTKNELDKVVVQAYGTTSQRLATGNIGVVRSEDIAKQPVMNVLQAVQGQVAGVVVTNTSGYASSTIKVEIRGRNAIGNFPSDPLYIIDGVPLTILDITGSDTYDNGSQGVIQA
ncbi:MAG TPA: carboxypeptidase-like regulatory domain-containing protein, partial [Puia sp.]|nr:carboxypeptidase-like regulatory domain-containing protein [Puia sp.]